MHILGMSDSPNVPSGFGTAMNGLMTQLGTLGHECFYLGWQWYGDHDRLQKHDKFMMLQNFGGHPFGAEALGHHLMTVQPNVLLALADFHMTHYILNFPRVVPYCHWFPIDGTPVTTQLQNFIRHTDL